MNFDSTIKRAIRVVGLIATVALLTAFLLGREVPVYWVVLVGAMIGLDPVTNYSRSKE